MSLNPRATTYTAVNTSEGYQLNGVDVIDSNGNFNGGSIPTTETVAAANVIAASESGSVFVLSSATEFASTLPAPAAGLNFKFIVGAAPSGADYTIVTNGSANVIEGTVIVNGASVLGSNEDTISFKDGAAVVGDWVAVVSDGTSWFVSGVGSAAASITLTQAS